jgi:hypothetical protein
MEGDLSFLFIHKGHVKLVDQHDNEGKHAERARERERACVCVCVCVCVRARTGETLRQDERRTSGSKNNEAVVSPTSARIRSIMKNRTIEHAFQSLSCSLSSDILSLIVR